MDHHLALRRLLALLGATGLFTLAVSGPAFAEEAIVYTRPHKIPVCPYGACTEVWIANSDGSNAQLITAEGRQASLSPDGQLVAVMHADQESLQIFTTDGTLRETYANLPGGFFRQPRFSPDGKTLIYQGATSAQDIYSIPRGSSTATLLIGWENDQASPTFSANGEKIAFTSITDPDGEFNGRLDRGPLPYSIYMADSDGTDPVRVTPLTIRAADSPKFSPDGRQIAFGGVLYDRRTETGGVWVINTDGSGLSLLAAPGGNLDWSPDGSRIIFSRANGIWSIKSNGGDLHQIINDSESFDPSFRQPRSSFDPNQLLEEFAPEIRYDEQESFYADSAAEMTNNPGNSLRREDGSVIAESVGSPPNQLSLGFLASPTYTNGVTTLEDDFLDANNDYELDAQEMHSDPFFANQIYGRAFERDNKWWLQYWFFYYYNPQELLGVGVHEGDWEGIQLELDENGAPITASYAQHSEGQTCEWTEVEKQWIEDRVAPVVYSARASHASYFHAGVYRGGLDPLPDDYATGSGLAIAPTVTAIDDALPAWIEWPGPWGASGSSPRGPLFNGERWNDPEGWANSLDGCPSEESFSGALHSDSPVPAPEFEVRRQGQKATIDYSFPKWPRTADARPKMLVISIDPAGQSRAGLPYTPVAETYRVDTDHGHVVQAIGLGVAPYVVRISAFSKDGVRSDLVSEVIR